MWAILCNMNMSLALAAEYAHHKDSWCRDIFNTLLAAGELRRDCACSALRCGFFLDHKSIVLQQLWSQSNGVSMCWSCWCCYWTQDMYTYIQTLFNNCSLCRAAWHPNANECSTIENSFPKPNTCWDWSKGMLVLNSKAEETHRTRSRLGIVNVWWSCLWYGCNWLLYPLTCIWNHH